MFFSGEPNVTTSGQSNDFWTSHTLDALQAHQCIAGSPNVAGIGQPNGMPSCISPVLRADLWLCQSTTCSIPTPPPRRSVNVEVTRVNADATQEHQCPRKSVEVLVSSPNVTETGQLNGASPTSPRHMLKLMSPSTPPSNLPVPRKCINVSRDRPMARRRIRVMLVDLQFPMPRNSINTAPRKSVNTSETRTSGRSIIFRISPLDQSGVSIPTTGASIVRAVKWQCPEECSLIPPGVYRTLPNALVLDFDVFVLGFDAFDLVIGLEGPRLDLDGEEPTPPYPHSPARRRDAQAVASSSSHWVSLTFEDSRAIDYSWPISAIDINAATRGQPNDITDIPRLTADRASAVDIFRGSPIATAFGLLNHLDSVQFNAVQEPQCGCHAIASMRMPRKGINVYASQPNATGDGKPNGSSFIYSTSSPYGRREGPGSISDFAFVIVIPKVGGSNLGPEYIVLPGLFSAFSRCFANASTQRALGIAQYCNDPASPLDDPRTTTTRLDIRFRDLRSSMPRASMPMLRKSINADATQAHQYLHEETINFPASSPTARRPGISKGSAHCSRSQLRPWTPTINFRGQHHQDKRPGQKIKDRHHPMMSLPRGDAMDFLREVQ
ncbi:hypothetical protein EV121DRAFT_272501 [Schizophyllum commune]